ncbi:MAG TPA: polysaccharide biosynthesis/export family protein [Pyrinomonadaceae bacterium]|jgi:polysaccharide export outer membrane protein
MKSQSKLSALALSLLLSLSTAAVTAAQDTGSTNGTPKTDGPTAATPAERLEPDDVPTATVTKPATPDVSPTTVTSIDVTPEMQAGRREELSEEEAAILPYYNNYLTTYRLGPEDIISVTVFGQDRYSRSGIIVPPNGRINYPLIPDGILVAGKTTEQVAAEMTKRLDEYIIDPKITVMLEKAQSARYSVLGDVGTPGIRIMTRRLSVYEALAEAGGVLDTGDKSKVVLLRRQADGTIHPKIINIKKYERGDAREMDYLAAGDQVIVPGNRLKKFQEIMKLLPIVSFARIFTGGW